MSASGFQPNEPVQIILHSTPIPLTSVTATASGEVNAAILIPGTVEPGDHRIELRGSVSGSRFIPLTVTAVSHPTTAKANASSGHALAATGADTSAASAVTLIGTITAGAGALLLLARRRRLSDK